MDKIKIGILGVADIAQRRFLPALNKSKRCEFVAVAVATEYEKSILNTPNNYSCEVNEEKFNHADMLAKEYGGIAIASYEALLNREDIDAVYIPLPPALHFFWGKKALLAGKHVLMEKPFATRMNLTGELVELAAQSKLAIFENYGFIYHNQMRIIENIIEEGTIGKVKQISTRFGFPRRDENDFRYNRELGGGALLDCGGYTVKIASFLLGDTMKIKYSKLVGMDDYNVDGFGVIVAENDDNQIADMSFGMDNSYKCDLEIWGTCGKIVSKRIFTAPPDYNVDIEVVANGNTKIISSMADDQFYNVIEKFADCINSEKIRKHQYLEINKQSEYIQLIRDMNGEK